MASSKSKPKQVFTALIENSGDGMDTAFVSMPFSVQEVYGTNGQVKVKALFDGHPYRGILSNMGTGCHAILLRKDVRAAIGKKVGDKVKVVIEQDLEKRVVNVPAEMKKLLKQHAQARKFFDALSYTNQKEYAVWIDSAKRTETRLKRLAMIIPKLLEGKKNPSAK